MGSASDNLFGKILSGELPSHCVYEDEDCYAFLDIFPQTRGHTLVIPRTYCRTLLDAEPEVVKRCIAVVQLIAGPIASYCGADAFTVLSNNGRQAGQMVDYLHWHVIPRCEGDAVSLYSPGPAANQAELAKLAEQLRGAIANHHFVHRDGTT